MCCVWVKEGTPDHGDLKVADIRTARQRNTAEDTHEVTH